MNAVMQSVHCSRLESLALLRPWHLPMRLQEFFATANRAFCACSPAASMLLLTQTCIVPRHFATGRLAEQETPATCAGFPISSAKTTCSAWRMSCIGSMHLKMGPAKERCAVSMRFGDHAVLASD